MAKAATPTPHRDAPRRGLLMAGARLSGAGNRPCRAGQSAELDLFPGALSYLILIRRLYYAAGRHPTPTGAGWLTGWTDALRWTTVRYATQPEVLARYNDVDGFPLD